jgi:hypothetical protein
MSLSEFNPNFKLQQWGIENKEPKDLFKDILIVKNSISPIKNSSINIENIEKVTKRLEFFLKEYEAHFNFNTIPPLEGLAKTLRKVQPERSLYASFYHVFSILSQDDSALSTEDWRVKIAAVLDKIHIIISKCLLDRELHEFGAQIFTPGPWGVVNEYANIKKERRHLSLLIVVDYVTYCLHYPSHPMSEEDWETIRITYQKASQRDQRLFFYYVNKNLGYNIRISNALVLRIRLLLDILTDDSATYFPFYTSHCRSIARLLCSGIGDLKNVKAFNWSGCWLSSSQIMQMPKALEELNLSNEGWTDPKNDAIGHVFQHDQFPNLKILDLRNNPDLTEEMIDHLKEIRPDIQVLSDLKAGNDESDEKAQ